jgi:hypothetical protein
LNDPLHHGFHRIIEWNLGVREDAKQKAIKEFDKRVGKPKQKEKKWKSLDI